MRKETREMKDNFRKQFEDAKAEHNFHKCDMLRKEYNAYHKQRRNSEARARARAIKDENEQLLKDYFNNVDIE